MMPSHRWARNLTINDQDIEFLTNLLLEREIPLKTEALARALIEERLQQEAAVLQERFKDTLPYNPSQSYEVGHKLVFSILNYETGTVTGVRAGNNPAYGAFSVIAVQFDDNRFNNVGKPREFAAELTTPHKLSQEGENGATFAAGNILSADEILEADRDEILRKVEEALSASPDLVYLAQQWFPYDLLLEANLGHRNLTEAVLDMAGGGPLTTDAILQEIGGLGNATQELQVYSLNYALNDDDRFDEVGPTGEVLWYLTRLEPPEVRQIPTALRYTPIEYDRSILTPDMVALEAEIGDELSPAEPVESSLEEARISLLYPHRRLGTLPLNRRLAAIFPTARMTPRIWVTLVDGQDGEEYPAWVVREPAYIFGLAKFYRKHKLPVGATIIARRSSDDESKIVITFNAYRPRTEWIRLAVPHSDAAITFENQKRTIGAEYDELMILGVDDLAGVDAIVQNVQQSRRSLLAVLKMLIPPLGALTPQGTVHATTLYSALNILRRCPPGPMLATLLANPDFENVGGHYWKLRFN